VRVLRDQAGETLVEVMMTVAIMGMAMVAVLGGVGASMRFSGSHRSSASAGVALVAAAEAIKAYDPASATCSTLEASYQPAIDALTDLPSGWSTTDLEITGAACVTVNGVQKAVVTVTATSPDGESVESVDVVRRSIS
jgi:type II secretory pathway pseudopilin PulG